MKENDYEQRRSQVRVLPSVLEKVLQVTLFLSVRRSLTPHFLPFDRYLTAIVVTAAGEERERDDL